MATLMDLCIAKGISSIKLDNGVELVFRDKVVVDAPTILSPEIPTDLARMPTDDEMLLYSSEAFDEVREQRTQAILPPKPGGND